MPYFFNDISRSCLTEVITLLCAISILVLALKTLVKICLLVMLFLYSTMTFLQLWCVKHHLHRISVFQPVVMVSFLFSVFDFFILLGGWSQRNCTNYAGSIVTLLKSYCKHLCPRKRIPIWLWCTLGSYCVLTSLCLIGRILLFTLEAGSNGGTVKGLVAGLLALVSKQARS